MRRKNYKLPKETKPMITRSGSFIQNPFKESIPIVDMPPVLNMRKEITLKLKDLIDLSDRRNREVGVLIKKDKQGNISFSDINYGNDRNVNIRGKYYPEREEVIGTIHIHPSFYFNNKMLSKKDVESFLEKKKKLDIVGVKNEFADNEITVIRLEKLKPISNTEKYKKLILENSKYLGINQHKIIDNKISVSIHKVKYK